MKLIFFIALIVTYAFADLERVGEVVVDHSVGLMWQDNEVTKTQMLSFDAAQAYCKKLHFNGHSNWRLPVIEELKSISDKNRYDPAINETFKNTASDLYWSSSELSAKYTWNVDFEGAGIVNRKKSSKDYVRCVAKIK